MSAKQALMLVFFTLSTFSPLTTHAAYWSPHIGANYKFWGIEPAEPYEEVFPRIKNGFNLYAGTRINGFFGVDVGYEQSPRAQETKTFDGTEIIFVNVENRYDATDVTIRLRSYFLDLNFYWEVARNFELLFMMGVAYLHPDTHVFHLTDGAWLEYRDETEIKWSGRFGLGAQYNILPCLGLKALVNWDQTRRINFLGLDQHSNFYDLHPYHRATSFSFGVVYSFSKPRRGEHCPSCSNERPATA